MKLRIRAAVRTDAGRVRANNEDNFYLNGRIRQNVRRDRAHARCAVRTGPFLAAVADGMGGEARGELASLLAVQSLRPCPFAQAVPTALACVAEANAHICEQIVQIGGRMGSTLAALFAEDGRAICCNIGDRRTTTKRGAWWSWACSRRSRHRATRAAMSSRSTWGSSRRSS